MLTNNNESKIQIKAGVAANLSKSLREYYSNNYDVYKNKTDLYAFFIEMANRLVNANGIISFIVPHTWLGTTSFQPLRELLLNELFLKTIVELDFGVFKDAFVKTVIFNATTAKTKSIQIFNSDFKHVVKIPIKVICSDCEKKINLDWTPEKQEIFDKIFDKSDSLGKIIRFTRGVKTSNDKRFLKTSLENNDCKKVIRGRNIKAYRIDFENEYLWYRPDLMKEKVGCLPHTSELFEVKEKLITQRVNSSGQLLVTYDDEQYYCLDTTNVSCDESHKKNQNLKYILAVLNSKLINWWFNDTFKMPTISGYELHQIPMKTISIDNQKPFISKAGEMLILNRNFSQMKSRLIKRIKQNLHVEKISDKLNNFYNSDFKEFLVELSKQKIKLSLKQQDEWEDYFNKYKDELIKLQKQINDTDNEINQIVYELYGLTNEEIAIIEGSIKE